VRAPGAVAPHLLIKSGATLVECADDILEAIGVRSDVARQKASADLELSAPFESILRHLEHEPVSRETLAERLHKSVPELSALLLELELQGLVRCLSSGSIVKT
jgi:DNA processing protein